MQGYLNIRIFQEVNKRLGTADSQTQILVVISSQHVFKTKNIFSKLVTCFENMSDLNLAVYV